MTSSDNPKVRRFEGRIPVKGFKIGYVLWIPFNERSIGYESQNIAIDPLSMTNYFDETIICFHGWLDNANSYATLAPLLCTRFKNTRVISIDLPGIKINHIGTKIFTKTFHFYYRKRSRQIQSFIIRLLRYSNVSNNIYSNI